LLAARLNAGSLQGSALQRFRKETPLLEHARARSRISNRINRERSSIDAEYVREAVLRDY